MPISRPNSRHIRPALTATAALLSLLASLAAVLLAVAGPAHTGRAALAEGHAVTVVARPALVSDPTMITHYTHRAATLVNRYPNPDWRSSTYTAPQCERTQEMIGTGVYSYGTSYANDGASYDRDNVFLHGGIYTWSDCLLASPNGGYLQLSRLRPAWLPDDGTHDAAVIFHSRTTPLPIDEDDAGRVQWGSFLDLAE